MTKRVIKDVAASVRQRLQNNARETGRPFQEVLQYFAMERLLYRLSQSPHANKFVLKGALMLAAWQAPVSRPTKDIDLLAKTGNDIAAIEAVVRDICTTVVQPDGLRFDRDSVEGTVITEDADYEGVRVTFLGYLERARISMQIDFGFGDVLVPRATLIDYPTILDFKAPRLRGYSRESAVAEKFEAMVKLGQINSRMKDFFDIWLLARQYDFAGETLASAIEQTFARRGTTLSASPVALRAAFADPAKVTQWNAFRRTSRLDLAPSDLTEVISVIREFLHPVATAIRAKMKFDRRWSAPGPWEPTEE